MAKVRCKECAKQCGKAKADMNIITKLEAEYKIFASSPSKSLLKKYLTQDIFDKLKMRKTSFGSTLMDCVQSGFANPESGVGIYAPDPEAYDVFRVIFNPIIQDYHLGFKRTDIHPATNFGDVNKFTNIDPSGKYVVSLRVRCGRSIEDYPFNPCLTEEQYLEIESKVTSALKSLIGDLKVDYYPLKGMSKEVQKRLTDDHFLFKEGDKFLQDANASRFWPTGRGIFHNMKKTFIVWLNEEDHIRIISMQPGGNLGEVYKRFVKGVNEIEKKIKYSRSDRLGYLTFCPTNLGTAIRASVHIRVPNLASNMEKFKKLAEKYNLQIRGTAGEHTEAKDGIYDISNKRRLGLTEFEAIQEMHDGILEIIKQEKLAKPPPKPKPKSEETDEEK